MYTKPTYAKQLPTILASIDNNGKDAPKDIKPLEESRKARKPGLD